LLHPWRHVFVNNIARPAHFIILFNRDHPWLGKGIVFGFGRYVVSLIVIMKFFHYFALFLAGGGGIAGGVLAAAHKRAEVPPAPPVQAASMILARLSLVAIVTLWVTGFVLAYAIYGGMDIGWAFHMKLLGATGLLASIGYVNYHLSARGKQGLPPSMQVIKMATMIGRGSLVLVLAGIAIATTTV